MKLHTLFGTALLLIVATGAVDAQLVPRTHKATSGPNPVGPPQPWSRVEAPAPRILELLDSYGEDIAVAPDGVVHIVGSDASLSVPRAWTITMPDPADPGQDVLLVEDKPGEGRLGPVDADASVYGGGVGPVVDSEVAYWFPGDPNPNLIPELVPGVAAIVNGIATTPSGIVMAGSESSTPFIWDAAGGTRPLLDLDGSLGSGGTGRVARNGTIVGFGPDPLTGNNVGLLWVDEVPQALDDPTAVGTITFAISPDATKVGGSSVDSTGPGQPAIWRAETGMVREVLLDGNGAPFFFGANVIAIEDDGFALVNSFDFTGNRVDIWHPSFGALTTKPLPVFLAEQGVPLSGEVFTGAIDADWDGTSYHLLLAEQGGNEYYVSCEDLD